MIDWLSYFKWRPEFERLTDQNFYPINWIDAQIMSGAALLLATEGAAIIVDIKSYPGGACDVHGVVAAGNLAEIVNTLIPAAEIWGSANGCVGACLESREGWAKVLKPAGYVAEQVVLRKDFAA